MENLGNINRQVENSGYKPPEEMQLVSTTASILDVFSRKWAVEIMTVLHGQAEGLSIDEIHQQLFRYFSENPGPASINNSFEGPPSCASISQSSMHLLRRGLIDRDRRDTSYRLGVPEFYYFNTEAGNFILERWLGIMDQLIQTELGSDLKREIVHRTSRFKAIFGEK